MARKNDRRQKLIFKKRKMIMKNEKQTIVSNLFASLGPNL